MSEKPKGLDLLRQPFPKHQISLLPKPFKRDSPKGKCQECGGFHGLPATHLEYVGHAALTDRLLEADPMWNWEPLHITDGLPAFDKSGGLWIKLTVCGVTRLGYGHAEQSQYNGIGSREKEVIGDALRNAAMRFGAALDLWHKGDLHGEDEESKVPTQNSTPMPISSPTPPIQPDDDFPAFDQLPDKPKSNGAPTEKQLNRLFAIANESGWAQEDIKAFMKMRYKIESTKELTIANYDFLCSFIEGSPKTKI